MSYNEDDKRALSPAWVLAQSVKDLGYPVMVNRATTGAPMITIYDVNDKPAYTVGGELWMRKVKLQARVVAESYPEALYIANKLIANVRNAKFNNIDSIIARNGPTSYGMDANDNEVVVVNLRATFRRGYY